MSERRYPATFDRMLRGRTSDTAEGATIEADVQGFAALGEVIASGTGRLPLVQDGDPSPYRRWLAGIAVQSVDGPRVTIGYSVDQQDLVISCPADRREILAANIAGDWSEVEVGYHLHIEFHPGHFYLDEGALPLVVQLI